LKEFIRWQHKKKLSRVELGEVGKLKQKVFSEMAAIAANTNSSSSK